MLAVLVPLINVRTDASMISRSRNKIVDWPSIAPLQELITSNHVMTPLYTDLGRFETDIVDVGDSVLFFLNIIGTYVTSQLLFLFFFCKIFLNGDCDISKWR